MSRLLMTLPMILLALGAHAEPAAGDCQLRAQSVVAQLEREASEPLSREQAQLAYRAALASCQGSYTPPADASPAAAAAADPASDATAEEEASGSRFERLLAGLFSMEPRKVKTRPGGKARYTVDD